jgi:hypothetical protein
VLANAAWGIQYFQEVSLNDSLIVTRLIAGVVLVIVGAYLLAEAG